MVSGTDFFEVRSDVWHAAIPEEEDEDNDDDEASTITTLKRQRPRPRKSFDVRCLVLFDEIVPTEYDRFHKSNYVKLSKQPNEYWIG